ncbi:TPA: hypothetical protein SLN40_004915 [Serratia marcescens]|uniref:hypothetical protein n=1 Tax=Serratia sp. CY38905 TaxID=3383613 RepID=UPI0029D16A49|nr:hypothetical protein [Serratia marcescens]HEI9731530.1 hypothetical protein [Serratia marcescens]HEI9758227.1 hypothetical protein [Serratia marcescens]HEI9761586.1 hypothetical protein [Serratia marcescens]
MREITSPCQPLQFTQGAIFNGLENSVGQQTLGVVITARCDIEHQKVKKIVCLPIYKLSDWMLYLGNDEVFSKAKAGVEEQLNTMLLKYDLSYGTYKIFGIEHVLDVLEKKGAKKDKRDLLTKAHEFIHGGNLKSELKNVKEANKRYFESLVYNSKADAHFFESLISDEIEGYIVDLSEPISIPIGVMIDISKGLHYQKYNRKRNEGSDYKSIKLHGLETARFLSVINSPYLEHLLQRFSQFYCRIGTEDVPVGVVDILKDSYEKR